MRVAKYTLFIFFLPTFAYTIYWTQFTADKTSNVPASVVLILGIGLFICLLYLVIIKSHNIKKVGLGGQLQEPEH